MSGPVPQEEMSEPMRAFLQQLTESTGFPNHFRLRKLSDTQACLQMKIGTQWLTGPTWTFS